MSRLHDIGEALLSEPATTRQIARKARCSYSYAADRIREFRRYGWVTKDGEVAYLTWAGWRQLRNELEADHVGDYVHEEREYVTYCGDHPPELEEDS